MTNEIFNLIQFFPVKLTGSQTENRLAFGRKKILFDMGMGDLVT
jgi:hypothetical protein